MKVQMTNSFKTLAMFAIAGLCLTACKKQADATDVAEETNETVLDQNEPLKDDSEYVVETVAMNLLEVEMGRLAQQKSSDPDVKAYGTMMVDHHTKANSELSAAASSLGITVPQALDHDDADKVADLAKKSGNDFDKDFADMMVKNHDEAIEDATEASEKANNGDLKAWYSNSLTTLRQHKSQAEALVEKIKNKK